MQSDTDTRGFKTCSLCGTVWLTKESFLDDEQVVLNGYQWDKAEVRAGFPAHGLLVFTHEKHLCGTSLTVLAREFRRK